MYTISARSKNFIIAEKQTDKQSNRQTDKQTYDTQLRSESKPLGPGSPGLAAKICLYLLMVRKVPFFFGA